MGTFQAGRLSGTGRGRSRSNGESAYLFIDENELLSMLKSMDTLKREISSKATRRRISNLAAVPVQLKAREIAAGAFKKNPRDRVHYYYKKGQRVATIYAGHTEAALQVLTKKRNKLPRTSDAITGPLKTGDVAAGGTFGRSKALNPSKVDAYYAQMIFGNARAFGERISRRALQLAANEAFRIYDAEVTKETNKQTKRTGWR